MNQYESRENIFNANKSFDALEIDETNKLIRVNYYCEEKTSIIGKLLESGNSIFQPNTEFLTKNLFNPLLNKHHKYKSLINKASKIFKYNEILGYELSIESDKKNSSNSDMFDEIANVVAGRQVANLASGMLKKMKKVNITHLALEIKTSNNEKLPIVYVNAVQPVLFNSGEYNLLLTKISSITGFIDNLVDCNEKVEFSPNFVNDLFEIDENSQLIKLKYKQANSIGMQTDKYEIIKFQNLVDYKVKVDSEEMTESSGLLSTKGVSKVAGKVNPFFGKVMKTVNAVSNFAPHENEKKIIKIRQVCLNVNTNILSKPIIKMQILNSPIGINSDSREYFEINNKLEEVTSIFDRILVLNGKNGATEATVNYNLVEPVANQLQSTSIDKFEEVKKLKELMDMGILSQEEFNKKKVELLNL